MPSSGSLRTDCSVLDLGRLSPGQRVERCIDLLNDSTREVSVSVGTDVPWLVVVEPESDSCRLRESACIRVRVEGDRLPARSSLVSGNLHFRSPIGTVAVEVRVQPSGSPPLLARLAAIHPIWLIPPFALLVLLLLLALLLPGRSPNRSVASGPGLPETPAVSRPEPSDPNAKPSPTVTRPPVRLTRPAPPREDVLPREFDLRPGLILVPEIPTRDVDVVFCLDTTASMGGLLDGAKATIWSICNRIAAGRPTPTLRVGLLAYRDRKDRYVTKLTPLTADLDLVHTELHALEADGGGDFPESVNQALAESVSRISWSTDKKTLRMIFLVGDAPPHMDYKDDIKYPETCKKAIEKGIHINTVQCGNDGDTERFWKDIAAKADGKYMAIPQTGGVQTFATEFDAPLAEIGRTLLDSALVYGTLEERKERGKRLATARGLTGIPAADRAAYAARTGRVSPFDLLDALESKTIRLATLPADQQPDELRGRSSEEQQRILSQRRALRISLRERALELETRRARAQREAREKQPGGKGAFDTRVMEIIREQGSRFGIAW